MSSLRLSFVLTQLNRPRKTFMSLRFLILRILGLGIFTVIGLFLAISLGQRLGIALGIGIALYVVAVNAVFLIEKLYPWRWLVPALGGMFLLVVYPAGYAVVVSFTNYGDGNLLTQETVVQQRLRETFAPEDASSYQVTIYRDEANDAFRFWLVDEADNAFIYAPGDAGLTPVAADEYQPRNDDGVPDQLNGYNLLRGQDAIRFATTLQEIRIAAPPNEIQITDISLLRGAQAQELQPRWAYDTASGVLTNRETGVEYRADGGNFVAGEGENREVLTPGFPAFIGLENFTRVITDPFVRDPFWRVFLWNLAFAAGSVFLCLGLGMVFAMVLNARELPLRVVWRSILILPYAIPGWLLVVTWRGLLNTEFGPVSLGIESIFGSAPQWFSDPTLAKIGVLFVNMYLGFPYMMLITLGALQSIPGDMYEAATIDGATIWEQFRSITLPMLLVALSPLLVAAFAFNFNNFTIVELFNNGGPPMGAATVAGHTDLLLSYTYRLAFSGSGGTDYGFAAAIGIFIFFIIGPITYFNFRLTGRLEELNA
jgi:ABC-type sugar transport system permease subunit